MRNKEDLSRKVWVVVASEIAEQKRWILRETRRIGTDKLLLLAKIASTVRENAYQPYSKYSVGAAILTIDGGIFSSCNAETVTYTETDHAERSVITQAVAKGAARKERNFMLAIAVSHPGESGPCGGCRQRIAEHADNCLVIDADVDGNIQRITSLDILFPYSFRPSHLGKDGLS